MKNLRNKNLLVSISKIEYCRADMIDGESVKNNFHTQMVFPFNKKWHEIYFTNSTAKFSQTTSRKLSGLIYTQSLKIQLPGFDDNNNFETDMDFFYSTSEAIRFPLILRLTTCAGQIIIIGRQESPVRFDENFNLTSALTYNQLTFNRISNERINIENINA